MMQNYLKAVLLLPLCGMVYFAPANADNLRGEPKQTAILLPYGAKDSLYSMECEEVSLETVFFENFKASTTFPRVPETNVFSQFVNEAIRKEACELHDNFVKEMSAPQDEFWEEDADERVSHYVLNLVYSTPCMMCFYGSHYQYRGGAHGSVRYITKTFKNQGETICELTLDDLFLPDYQEWLFQYCENHFKLNRIGYYKDDDHTWIGFNPENLDAFLPTENGLLLIFQNYVISGNDDYPVTLLIPYGELTPIAIPILGD